MTEIRTTPVGAFGENCGFAFLPEKKKLYLIDPGSDAGEIISIARAFPFESCEILLTHAHFDHISALAECARELHVKRIYLDPADLMIYRSDLNAMEPYYPVPENLPETSGDSDFGTDLQVLHLPGHTPGGSGFYFADAKVLFCGDTIFASSVGRTDFPGGDAEALENSIRKVIYALPDEVILLPGHGDRTTVGAEKKNNPYVRG